MIVDIDIMVNKGQTFYGRIKKEIQGRIKFEEDRVVEYIDEEDIKKIVLERFPTLRYRPYQVLYNQ